MHPLTRIGVHLGMNTINTFALALAFSCTSYSIAQSSTEPITDQEYSDIVAKQVQPAIDAEVFPGAMIAIYNNGQTHFIPMGTLNYDQDQSPTIDTLFEIGSISKVITGVLFADATRRDEVSRDTIVNDLLPDGTRVKWRPDEPLLLWHLTTHTSGWPTAPVNLVPADGERPFSGYTQDMMFDAINLMLPKQAPGKEFAYSNFAVGLLGTLIANNADSVNKGDYEALVKERILSPLNIDDFTIELNDEQIKRLAPPTVGGRNTKAWGKTGPMDPCGMWVSNAPGLLKFAVANLKAFDDSGEDITESLRLAREPLYKSEEMRQQVCSGWFIARDGQGYWHNGMTGGFSSFMGLNRELDLAVVVLANGAGFETTVVGEKILQSIAGMNPDPIVIEIQEKLESSYTDRLVGIYRASLGFDMTISASRGKLFAQITGQQALELAQVAENRFKIKLVDAQLGFDVPENGNATSVTLFQNGMEIKCERKE